MTQEHENKQQNINKSNNHQIKKENGNTTDKLEISEFQLYKNFNYNEKIHCEEDKYVEFKFIPEGTEPHQIISKYLKNYMNAFLNTDGGSIYFGVLDNQVVKGVQLSAKERDYIRLCVDQYCNQYVPQVDENLTCVQFVPVIFKENSQQKKDDMYVVIVSVKQGTQPIYFTNWKHDSAYIRRNAGITKMSKEMIIDRLKQGREQQTSQYLNVLGRQPIIDKCLNFSKNSQSSTKVIILYGLMSVGKSSISEYVKQQLMQYYPKSTTLKIDLKQQTNLKDSLIFLIKSLNPLYDLSYLNNQQNDEPEPSFSNTFNMLYKPTNLEQQLLNIYTNLINQQSKFILQIENVHKSCPFTEQLIPCGTQTIAILTARKMQQLYFLGPQVDLLQQQILPLTEKESAIILLTALPNQITLEQAQIIAKLTGGLPLVIRYIIKKCQLDRCNPDEVIKDLSELKPDQLTKKICPQVYSMLKVLDPLQLQILEYLCFSNIFSNQFIDYIQLQFKNISKQQFIEQVDNLIDMGLIQLIQVQCQSLNDNHWYLITDIVRSYIIHHFNIQSMKQCVNTFINYYLQLLQNINIQIKQCTSKQQSASDKTVVNTQLDLFLTLEQNYECVLQLILYKLNHRQTFDLKDSMEQLIQILDEFEPQIKFMTSNAQQLYDFLQEIKIGKQKLEQIEESSIEYSNLESCVFL